MKDFRRLVVWEKAHAHTAAGSVVELEYFLLLAHDLNFASAETYESLQADVLEVQRMLASLLRRVDGARRLQNKSKLQIASRS